MAGFEPDQAAEGAAHVGVLVLLFQAQAGSRIEFDNRRT